MVDLYNEKVLKDMCTKYGYYFNVETLIEECKPMMQLCEKGEFWDFHPHFSHPNFVPSLIFTLKYALSPITRSQPLYCYYNFFSVCGLLNKSTVLSPCVIGATLLIERHGSSSLELHKK